MRVKSKMCMIGHRARVGRARRVLVLGTFCYPSLRAGQTRALAEGEELGSNILHLGDNDPRSQNCRGERTSGQHARLICRMSALHPIATELWHCNEMTRRVESRCGALAVG